MLTDAQRQTIQLEERYRQEVRAQFKSPPPPLTLWSALNSQFGMWLLSAVLLSGVSTLYANVRADIAERAQARERVERLDFEIGFRFSQVQGQLERLDETRTEPGIESRMQRVLRMLREPPAALKAENSESYIGLYPEYVSFGIPALLAEERRYSDPATRTQLDRSLAHLSNLRVFLQVAKTPLSKPSEVAGAVISELVLPRWKATTKWYYLDGSRESPFP